MSVPYDDADDLEDECGVTFDHDDVVTYEDDEIVQWECRRCGAEGDYDPNETESETG